MAARSLSWSPIAVVADVGQELAVVADEAASPSSVAVAMLVAELAAVVALVVVASPSSAAVAMRCWRRARGGGGTGATGPARGWRWRCHPWGSRVPLLGQRAAS